jgi:hypothetical protein
MPSSSARGAHYKSRSKKWLLVQGYSVADMELVRVVHTSDGVFPTKRDQWGSDLAYFDLDAGVVVFVQVKGGGKPLVSLQKEAHKAFNEHHFPQHSRQELHVWRRMARAPEIYVWPNW